MVGSDSPRQLLGGWKRSGRDESPRNKTLPSVPVHDDEDHEHATRLPISARWASTSHAATMVSRPLATQAARQGTSLPEDAFTDTGGDAGSDSDDIVAQYTYNTDWAPPHASRTPRHPSPHTFHESPSVSSFASPPSLSATAAMSGPPPSMSSRRGAPPASMPGQTPDSDPSPPAYRQADNSTPPPSSKPPFSVPRYDKRGYPIKNTYSYASTTSSNPISPNSPKSASGTRPPSDIVPNSTSSDVYSRYPSEYDTPVGSGANTPNDPQQQHERDRLETITHPGVAAYSDVPAAAGNDWNKYNHRTSEYETTSTQDSHYYSPMPSSLYANGEPKPEDSLCGSIASTGDYTNSNDEIVYADFGINSKGRRQLVSMLHDPQAWANLGPEDDDDLHNPDVHQEQTGLCGSLLTWRGFTNVGCLLVLVIVLVVLFAGYPILYTYLSKPWQTWGAYNIGGVNATGQLPDVGPFQLIDKDTPPEAFTHTSLETGDQWELVFSDEFERPGRTFYKGDDPYWEAEDYHYWVTNNLEWYDPKQLITRDGYLSVTLTNETSHGLNYTGGLMTTWNRFCFTGGYIETKLMLPGKSNIAGLWPAVWTLGNLGRAGYGGTLEGMWPYTYDDCDVGTLRNQTLNGLPKLPKYLDNGAPSGDKWTHNAFSYLPGQRLSRCTCAESTSMHPGPQHSDGTFVGRSAPEIDVIEAQVNNHLDEDVYVGYASQSGQWAPFDPGYLWKNTSEFFTNYNESNSYFNDYQGSVQQQASSVVVKTNQDCYQDEKGCFSVYGFEYSPGYDGYITWVSDSRKSWRLTAGAMGANSMTEISARPVPNEPMYIVVNLGISPNFGYIDYDGLDQLWPVEMLIDYIRVYQDPKQRNIGCSPPDYPTEDYIQRFMPGYYNPNITTYEQLLSNLNDTSAHWPKNKLIDNCAPPTQPN